MKLSIFTDWGARGNPGISGCGFVVYSESEEILIQGYKFLGVLTNNQAEYQGLINGLTHALKKAPTHVHIHMDSELIIKQLQGVYKVKNANMKPLYEQVQMLIFQSGSQFTYTHVRREKNKLADKLANHAMDTGNEGIKYD